MLSEAQARELLQAAGDTIEVEPAQPLPIVDRPRIWPMLVAAAAVVAIVATTLAVADRGTTPPPPSLPPSPTPTLAANQIPPVMGLDPIDAEQRLGALRLVVRTRIQPGCAEPSVAAGTSPPVGTRFSPGDTVQLTVLDDSMDFCGPDQSRGWQLLRFGLGVSSVPLAERVTLYPGGGEPVRLSAAEAADAANWEVCDGDLCGSALSILAEAATTPSPSSPVLTTWDGPRAFNGVDLCMNGADVDTEGLTYLGITIDPPTDGVGICPEVAAYYSETGLLEAVAIPLNDEADAELTRGLTAEAMTAADEFVAWARGSGRPPAFADEVHYLYENKLIRAVTADGATRPGAWSFCWSGVSSACPSPLRALDQYEGVVVLSPEPATFCVRRTRALPVDLADQTLVRLDQPEPRNCRDAFAVELWVDHQGQISAANLLPGLPSYAQ